MKYVWKNLTQEILLHVVSLASAFLTHTPPHTDKQAKRKKHPAFDIAIFVFLSETEGKGAGHQCVSQ